MKIYCFSGLGADERVFNFLKLDKPFELALIDWINPVQNESLEKYSLRISKTIETKQPFGILGVSFGGLIAQEVSSILKPRFTIVISSINSSSQIPFVLRFLPNLIIKRIPTLIFKLPYPIANYAFSAVQKDFLHQIIKDTNPEFIKWAIYAFKNWKGEPVNSNIFFLCGEKDRLLKPIKGATVVPDAGHFMVVDLADQVSQRINSFLLNPMD